MVPSRHAKGHPSSLYVEESLRILCGWAEADSQVQARGPAGQHKDVAAEQDRRFAMPDSVVWSTIVMIGEMSLFDPKAGRETQSMSLNVTRTTLSSTVAIGIRVVVTSGAELDVMGLDVAEVTMIGSATVTSNWNDLINSRGSYINSLSSWT